MPEVCQSVPEQLMALIKVNPSISRDELSKQLNISVRQVRKIINQFKNDGVLTREGDNYTNALTIRKEYIFLLVTK